MTNTTAQTRYQYSGSYLDPKKYHFGSCEWIDEERCRHIISEMLRNPAIKSDSLRIIIQHKKKRWSQLRNGSVDKIFPDLWGDYLKDTAIDNILSDRASTPRIRLEARAALKHGLAEAIAHTEALLFVLKRLLASAEFFDRTAVVRTPAKRIESTKLKR